MRERGVQDLSLRELAREVGVSHGAPRRHFPDRQALLDALAESGFERLGAELRAAARRRRATTSSRGCDATAAAYIRFATTDPALLDLMFAVKAPRDGAEPARGDGARVLGDDGARSSRVRRSGGCSPATPNASASSCSQPSRGSPRS